MTDLYADYSLWRPTIDQLKALGVRGVCRYISDRDLSDTSVPAKNITPAEAKTLLDAGFEVVLVWETSAARAGEGASAGAEDVWDAENQANYLGYPVDAPIFYAVDYDATPAQVKAYLDSVVFNSKRPSGLGLYGGYDIIHAYVHNGPFKYGWQTSSWSENVVCDTGTYLYQNVRKGDYDLNEVRKPLPTAWKKAAPVPEPEPTPEPTPTPTPTPTPEPTPTSTGAFKRVTFEGRRTTARSVNMVKEARYLFRLRGGGNYPAITQGGYNAGGVAASAGTHDRDAHDYGTKAFSLTRAKLWEWCIWEVGFAAWRRPYIAGLWPAHTHAIPKGGDLSKGAKAQITQWNQGDDALKSDNNYPRIDSSGFKSRTWESYLSGRPTGNVSLALLVKAFQTAKAVGGNDVQQVQKALNHFLDSSLLVDGIAGPSTKAVYMTYQSRKYGVPKGSADANGIPGKSSLEGLGLTVVA